MDFGQYYRNSHREILPLEVAAKNTSEQISREIDVFIVTNYWCFLNCFLLLLLLVTAILWPTVACYIDRSVGPRW